MTVQLMRVSWQARDQNVSSSIIVNDVISVDIKKSSQASDSHASVVLQNAYSSF